MSHPNDDDDTKASAPQVQVGDVIRIRKNTYNGLIEVDYVDGHIVEGRIPYQSTYTTGGQYEGSYRGRQSAWLDQVVSVERPAADPEPTHKEP